MTEKNPDVPFPESDDNPSFEDVSSMDENDVTVILPEELGDEVGTDFTEEIPPDPSEQPGEVFVLLPDGDDSQIPMVETQEVTEEVESPRLTSAYDSSQDPGEYGRPTASQVQLRSDNPVGDGTDTDFDAYAEPTEVGLDTDRPTETMSAGDLDDFANEVADDMLVSEGSEHGFDEAEPGDYDDSYYDEAAYDDDEEAYDEPRYRSSSSSGKKIVLSLAALIAIAATGVHFFPGYFGLDPSFQIGEFVSGLLGGDTQVVPDDPVSPPPPPDGGVVDPGGQDDVPTLAQITQDEFRNKFRLAIELGFGEAPR